MPTSGSVNFSTSRDEIIKYALLNIGAIGAGVTPTSTQVTNAAYLLNNIVKQWHAETLPLWALKKGYILPFTGSNSIATTSHVVTEYIELALTTDEIATSTVISVSSTTGFAATVQVGIELDDGSMHWTTSNSYTATDITIADALPSAATTGNIVYVYDSADRVTQPIRILHAILNDVTSDSDQRIDIITYQEYNDLGSKTSEGSPNQLFYDRQLGTGTFFVYPRFSDGNKVIVFRYHRPFEDFDVSTDEPDFPQEWYMPLLWMLSWALCPSYGVSMEQRALMLKEALFLKEQTQSIGMEEGSLFFEPADRRE